MAPSTREPPRTTAIRTAFPKNTEWGRRAKVNLVRYADDCNIYVKSQRSAKRVLRSTTEFIESRMRLKVNAEKSAVGRANERTFLGFSFY